MPHVHISYPHKAKDGTKRVQGDTVYVTSTEAKNLVADGKGKIVTPSPEEVVALAGKKVPAKPEPGVERQVLAARQHVHAVDLHHTDPVDHPAHVPQRGGAGGPPVGEALGHECDTPGLGARERGVTPGVRERCAFVHEC